MSNQPCYGKICYPTRLHQSFSQHDENLFPLTDVKLYYSLKHSVENFQKWTLNETKSNSLLLPTYNDEENSHQAIPILQETSNSQSLQLDLIQSILQE